MIDRERIAEAIHHVGAPLSKDRYCIICLDSADAVLALMGPETECPSCIAWLEESDRLRERLAAYEGEPTIDQLREGHATATAQVDEALTTIWTLKEQVRVLREALDGLLKKWDEVEPAVTSAFAFQQIHGFKYSGPTLEAALLAARDALARTEPQE